MVAATIIQLGRKPEFRLKAGLCKDTYVKRRKKKITVGYLIVERQVVGITFNPDTDSR